MLKPSDCRGCILETRSNGFSVPYGTGKNGVVVVGEAAGDEEGKTGQPFYKKAQAGSKLEEIFRLEGEPRERFLITNLVQCQPPGNKLSGTEYEDEAINTCRERHFIRNIARVGNSREESSRVILALGNLPLKHLLGYSGEAERKESISHLRGFVYRSKYGLVVPSYHPSYLKRGKPELTPVLQFDLRKALEVANGKFTNYEGGAGYKRAKYLEHPTLDEAKAFYYKVRDNQGLLLTYDIETETSAGVDEEERDEIEDTEITQVQFSLGRGTAIVFDLCGEQSANWWKVSNAIFKLANPKLGHNCYNFDDPRLKAKGVIFGGNEKHDSQWMFKHYHPRLPRGLQPVASMAGFPYPWKHTFGVDLSHYGGCDVDAPHYIWEWLPPIMREMGLWEGYERHVRQIYTVLSRASDVGMPVDEEKRVGLKTTLVGERKKLNEQMQKLIPDEVRNLSPVRSRDATGAAVDYGYKKEPKEVRQATVEYENAVARVRGQGRRVASFDSFVRKKYGLVKRVIRGKDGDTGEEIEEERWCKIKEFKASSSQVIEYLKYKQAELLKEPKEKVDGYEKEES